MSKTSNQQRVETFKNWLTSRVNKQSKGTNVITVKDKPKISLI